MDFKENIHVGDLVVMPRSRESTISVGEMVGQYRFRPDAPGLFHTREVSWVNKAVLRSILAPDYQRFMNVPGNVRHPSGVDAEQRLRTVLETGRDPGPGDGEITSPWDQFVMRAKEYIASGRLESQEIEYKRKIAGKLARAREDVLASTADWPDSLKRALAPVPGFPVNWRLVSNFNNWCAEHANDAHGALTGLWSREDQWVGQRIDTFSEALPRSAVSGAGTRMNLISLLLTGIDVEQYPPFRVRLFNDACAETGYPRPVPGSGESAMYGHALDFLDRFIEEAAARGLQMRHRLDAQSVVWAVLQSRDEETELESEETLEEEPVRLAADPWSPSNLATLAGELLWKPEELREIIEDLRDKHQVIFYGPPGTGKTYVARAIAQQCRLNGGDFEIVQFHPSYSYEDFVEGFRPRLMDGQPGFELVSGPLLRIADKARGHQEGTFVLVIDELNRGNVAKVFGELYFLLEYRDEEVQLQYGAERGGFTLPSNLWFICTMNTADRSIALMDAALRRRFYFAPFFPDEPPIKGLLRRWLLREGQGTWAADLVDAANEKLDRDMGIGPSYFMSGGVLDRPRVSRIWNRSVLPYIEEQFFGDSAKLAEFHLERLARNFEGPAEADTGISGHQRDAGDVPVQDGADGADASRV